MKALIKEGLEITFNKVLKRVPETKIIEKLISVVDVDPLGLIDFMTENNIPDDAYFTGKDNGYDGWEDICLGWEVKVPTTDVEKLQFKRKRFEKDALVEVGKILRENGYTSSNYHYKKFKEIQGKEYLYDRYMKDDFNKLFELFSLLYEKK